MTVPKIIIFIFILPFFTYGQKNQKGLDNLKSDTLRDPSHYYYLADINPKILAHWFLVDSISPSDNFCSFRVIDSLNAQSFKDRQFYFQVYVHLLDKADGAFAEAVGQPALEYIEKHTKEFFSLSNTLTNAQFEKFVTFSATQFYFSCSNDDHVNNQGEHFVKTIHAHCSDCPEKTQNKIKEFDKIFMQTINDDFK